MDTGSPVLSDVMTQAEFERKRHVVCSLAAGVAREGRLLYAA